MGIDVGPIEVTDGLVFHIDVGNTRSYSGSGNTAYDLVSSGTTYALTNGPTFSSSNGGAIVFDGANDFLYNSVRSVTTEFQYNSAFTIVVWAKITENTAEGYLVNNRTQDTSGTQYTGWGLIHAGGLILGFVGGYPSNTYSWRRVSSGFEVFNNSVYNKWAHITYVNNGTAGQQKIYINGENATNAASDDTTPPYTVDYSGGTHRIYIGYDGTQTHPLTGNIAQVQIYNRALTAQEIFQNYNATKGRYR